MFKTILLPEEVHVLPNSGVIAQVVAQGGDCWICVSHPVEHLDVITDQGSRWVQIELG